jgi:choline dehydrogenase
MIFDYVIVGAGSAGCAVADALSRDGKHRVLLLEAGSDNRSRYVDMPRGWVKLWEDPRYFWTFPIAAQPGRPRGERWAYGKGLGGSSAVNGTMYFRGQSRDYEAWQRYGNSEWSWAEMQRVFQSMEDFRGPAPDASRGHGGPVEITELSDHSPVIRATIAAAAAVGMPFVSDLNGASRFGIGYTQTTVDRRGRRVSAYSAFLPDADKRGNLTILTDALVQRVVFEGRRAIGVECLHGGKIERFLATREIVVATGVMNSPKLLQMSGIGARALLEQHGVPVVHALPAVGQNLREHVMLSFSYRLCNATGLNREFRGWRLARNVLRYYLSGKGVMAFATTELSAFLSLHDDQDWPDVQLCISPYSFGPAEPGSKEEPGRGVPDREPGITITGMMIRARSRGTVALRSLNAAEAPLVEANWLTDPEDRRDVVAMVRAIRKVIRRPELSDFVGDETYPGDPADQTDEQILDSALLNLSSGLHGTGTCRMGSPDDSVVDSRLRVHGVSGLRVVDCSIMPTPISGNTNGPAMAVGRRAAELILEDAARGVAGRHAAPSSQVA